MNPSVILALISDLYSQIGHLTAENKALREQLVESTRTAPEGD